MSGHSKWATIKHKKGAADKARGKLWAKLIRQVEVAARAGGGDLDANPTLRTMVDKAKGASVPNDTIDRAIKRATGELEGVHYESATYEGYAPEGVAVFVEALTDNRNRTSADVRHLFSKNGGSIAEPGSVAWQFSRRGVIYIDGSVSEDDAMAAALEAGADDVARDGDDWRVLTDPSDVWDVKSALEAKGVKVTSAENTMVAANTVPVTDVEDAKKILKIMDGLEDNDDVQDVYANFDMSEEIMQAVN